MNSKIYPIVAAVLLVFALGVPPTFSIAEEAVEQDGGAVRPASQPRRPGFVHILGSIVFTTLHFPAKLVTCVGTQAVAAVAYTGTFGVEGSYDGDTNGKDIGETARRACTGSWIVRPSQVVRDYGAND